MNARLEYLTNLVENINSQSDILHSFSPETDDGAWDAIAADADYSPNGDLSEEFDDEETSPHDALNEGELSEVQIGPFDIKTYGGGKNRKKDAKGKPPHGRGFTISKRNSGPTPTGGSQKTKRTGIYVGTRPPHSRDPGKSGIHVGKFERTNYKATKSGFEFGKKQKAKGTGLPIKTAHGRDSKEIEDYLAVKTSITTDKGKTLNPTRKAVIRGGHYRKKFPSEFAREQAAYKSFLATLKSRNKQ